MQSPDHIFDSLLIAEHCGGNKKALGVLVGRWHPTFCKHAHWYVKDESIAKDIAQESWIVIIKKLSSLKDTNKFAPWALTIVHRKAMDHFRANKKLPGKIDSQVLERVVDASTNKSEQSEIEKDRLTQINVAISLLPLKQRIVIELFYKNELSLQQISEVIGEQIGTVKSRLFYARETLKKQLNTK